MRALLSDLSSSRARQGFTATETAASVHGLKAAVLKVLDTGEGTESATLRDYVTFADFVDRARGEAQRKQYWQGAKRYTVFNRRLESSATVDFRCDLTERYVSWTSRGTRPDKARHPPVVGMSVVSRLSLSSTGTPCNGPRVRPCRRSASSAAATASARGFSAITAFRRGPA